MFNFKPFRIDSKVPEGQVLDERVPTTNESTAKFEKDSTEKIKASGLGKKINRSGPKIRLRRVRASVSGISEVNCIKALECVVKEDDSDYVLCKIHSKPKDPFMKRLYNTVFGQDSPRVENTEEAFNANCTDTVTKSLKIKRKKLGQKEMKRQALCKKIDISKIFQEEGYEQTVTFDQLLKWVEEKSAMIETLMTNPEGTTEKIKAIETILEDVKKANRPIASKNEVLTKLIKTLEDNASMLLDIHRTAENCYGIRDLFTLVVHLTATAGTRVTVDDVQKNINRKKVLILHQVFQEQRTINKLQIKTNKLYIEHGLNEVVEIKEDYKEPVKIVEDIFSEVPASCSVIGMSLKLKIAASESVDFLKRYENAIGYLVTKAKVCTNLRKEADTLINKFMLQNIDDLFKAKP